MQRGLTNFTRMFAEANGLDIARWRFEPGMCHGDTQTWWGQKARRAQVHHGIDFVRYETPDGAIRELAAGMRVPLPLKGTVAGVMKDFMGHTVTVEHGRKHGRLLIGLYGHVRPVEGTLGAAFEADAIIGELAHPGKSPVPPHLHLGMALVPEGLDFAALSWDYLNSASDIEHIDPLEFL